MKTYDKIVERYVMYQKKVIGIDADTDKLLTGIIKDLEKRIPTLKDFIKWYIEIDQQMPKDGEGNYVRRNKDK